MVTDARNVVLASLLLVVAALAGPVGDAADAVQTAFGAKQDLEPLAQKDNPDPWLVADELCARGEYEAAAAFAKAAPRPDTKRLPDYVASQRKKPTDPKRRKLLAEVRALQIAGKSEVVRDLLRALDADGADVTAIRLLGFRAFALNALGAHDGSQRVYDDAVRRAEGIGWPKRAVLMTASAAEDLLARGLWKGPRALALGRRMLRLQTERSKRRFLSPCHTWIGHAHRNGGDLRAAIRSFEQAVALADDIGLTLDAVPSQHALTRVLLDVGQARRAKAVAEKALGIAKTLGNAEHAARARRYLAVVLNALGDHEGAIEHAEQSLTYFERTQRWGDWAATLGTIGQARQLRGETAAALRAFEKALELNIRAGDPDGIAAAHGALGDFHRVAGEFDQALAHLTRLLRYWESQGDPLSLARAHLGLGVLHVDRHDLKRARRHLEAARRVFERAGARPDEASVLCGLAKIAGETGRPREAIKAAERAVVLAREASDQRIEAGAWRALGSALKRTGRPREARAAVETALRISEALNDALETGETLQHLATICIDLGAYDAALSQCERARRILEPLPRPVSLAYVYQTMGYVYIETGRYPDAHRCLEASLRLAAKGEDRVAEAGALRMAASVWLRTGDYDRAQKLIERARALSVELRDRRGEMVAFSQLATLQCARGDFRAGIENSRAQAAIAAELGDPLAVAAAAHMRGNARRGAGELEKAMELQQEALRAAVEHGDPLLQVAARAEVGNLHLDRGQYAHAIEAFERAAKEARQLGLRPRAARIVGSIGVAHANAGRRVAALRHYEASLTEVEELGDRAGTAQGLARLAEVHAHAGEYGRAMKALRRALAIDREIGDDSATAVRLVAIGEVYGRQGDFARAIDYIERGRASAVRRKDGRGVALALGYLAMAYSGLGNYEKAADLLGRRLAFETRSGFKFPGSTLNALAAMHSRRGDHKAALEIARRGLEDKQARGLNPGLSYVSLAATCVDLGQLDEAERHANAALACGRTAADQECIAYAHMNLGLVYERRGDMETALGHYNHARRAGRDRGLAEAQRSAEDAARMLLRLDRTEEALPLLEEAIELLETRRTRARGLAGDLETRFAGRLREARPYELMAYAQQKLGRKAEALGYFERGRARRALDILESSRFDPLREAERRAREQRDTERVAAIARLRASLAASAREVHTLTYALSKRQTRARRAALGKELVAARQARAKELGRRALIVRDLVPGGAPVSAAKIRGLLRRDERLLFYWLDEEQGVVFVVNPDGVSIHRLGGTPQALAANIDAFLEAVRRRDGGARGVNVRKPAKAAALPRVGPRLIEALVPKAVRAELAGAARVYVVPHGALHRLPLEALPGWLDKLPPVAYVHSGSVLAWCRARRRAQEGSRLPILAVGDPVYARDGSLVPLPGTRSEVNAITDGVKGSVSLLGNDATKARLFELAPQARFLHLATHQVVDETEFRGYSRLALTAPRVATPEDDGFLSLFELFEKWRDRLSGCELVVLSACETVKGPLQEDEGPYAMPLGFLYAGAPAVIGSLWRVDDESTAKLFGKFYEELKAGKGKLEAFTAARKWLKEKYPDTYHWAPFVFIGDPR